MYPMVPGVFIIPTDVESQCAEDKPSRERFLSLVAASVVCCGGFECYLSRLLCMKTMQFR